VSLIAVQGMDAATRIAVGVPFVARRRSGRKVTVTPDGAAAVPRHGSTSRW